MKYKGPFVYPTVDVAVVDPHGKRLLLGRKPKEKLLRFVGGFADVSSPSYEADALREVKEETSLSVEDIEYIGSTLIDDDRFRQSDGKIKTLFYVAMWKGGEPVAQDDLKFVCWKNFGEISEGEIMHEHRPLIRMLNDYFKGEILSLQQVTL